MPLPAPLPEGTTMLPQGSFAGKVVAITGAGTGLGGPRPHHFTPIREQLERGSFVPDR
jgi:hypothetical protein